MAKFEMFCVGDRAAFIRKSHVAVGVVNVPTYETLTWNVAYDRVEVIRIPVAEMGEDSRTKGQYYPDDCVPMGGPQQQAKNHLKWLRNRALECGATPDAIRLLTIHTGLFTKKEEQDMAEKLKSKTAAAKAPKVADKEALKSAAKAAPVGGKKAGSAPAKKGNAEALAKAREARSNTPDTRKIKPLVKAKDLTSREGSFRRFMSEDALTSKTVQEWRDKGKAADRKYDAGCLKFLVDNNIVSVG